MIRFDCTLRRPQFVLEAAFDSDVGVTGVMGPSGSGKSTVIQLIAGHVRPSRGRIEVAGQVVADTARRIHVPPHHRGVGLVFQDAQLFPHLTVRQNLKYGAFFNPRPPRRVDFGQVVDVLGIGHLLERAPTTLSGGERQRVAIGRALLAAPAVLLMDEPLSSLDASRKLEILPFIERLRDEFEIPILYVSHAAEEIARLATRVVRIEKGRVVAAGKADEVLTGGTPWQAAERFDAISTLTGRMKQFDAAFGVSVIAHPAGEIIVPGRISTAAGAPVRVAVRATNVTLGVGRPAQVSIRTVLAGRIARIHENGPFAQVSIELEGGDHILAFVTRLAVKDLGLDRGDSIHALVKAVAIDERGVTGMQIT
jgi:molybdate transport system ATP-binding protein